MTFTWAGDLSTNLDLVRFHIGDTNEDAAWLTDETIGALITREGSVNAAVIACIRYIITQLSRPDFKADWLSVSHEKAREGWEMLLREKRREFGITTLTASTTHVYRSDSLQEEEPDYDD